MKKRIEELINDLKLFPQIVIGKPGSWIDLGVTYGGPDDLWDGFDIPPGAHIHRVVVQTGDGEKQIIWSVVD